MHKDNATAKEQADTIALLKNDLKTTKTSFDRSTSTLEKLASDLQAAENGVCPACDQATAHLETHAAYTQEVKDKIAEETDYHNEKSDRLSEIEEAISILSADLVEPNTTFYKTVEEAYEHKHNMESLADQYEGKQAEDGIRDRSPSRGLGDVYKRQPSYWSAKDSMLCLCSYASSTVL